MKRYLPLCAAVGLGMVLAGCGGPPPAINGSGIPGTAGGNPSTGAVTGGGDVEPPSEPGKYGGKLTVAALGDPKTFNVVVASETSSSDVLGRLYEGLNDRNRYTLRYEPRLAELPEITSDGLTYTYKLKEGVKWSDGRPITADDAIFTLDVIFDPKIDTNMREGMLIDVPQPDGTLKREPFKYRKVDDRTVEFTLPVKYAPAESIFSYPIVPKHKLEGPYRAGRFNSTWGVGTPVNQIVGSGPWVLKEYAPKQRLVYSRNPYYWKKTADGKPLPYLDQYVELIVGDMNAQTLRFRNGDTDVLGIQPSDYPTIKKEESAGNYTVIPRGPSWGFEFLGFNQNPNAKIDKNLVQLFSDVRFRRAISHATNRERMVRDIYRGLGEPQYGPETRANRLFYYPDVPKFEYDLDKARALLAEIGLKDTNGNKFLEFNGKEVKFKIYTNSGNKIRESLAIIAQNDLRNIGLNASFTPVDFNDLVRRLMAPPYEWEGLVLGITGSPEPHSGSNVWRSTGPLHFWYPKQAKPATEWEAEIDKLWVQGAQELDPAKRKAIYDRWQTIVGEQQPVSFTVVLHMHSAVRNRFGNIKPPAWDVLTWNLDEIYDRQATREAP